MRGFTLVMKTGDLLAQSTSCDVTGDYTPRLNSEEPGRSVEPKRIILESRYESQRCTSEHRPGC